MSNIQQIPLDQLRISQRNARRTAGNGVADLAASIKAEGLLQNLVVTRADDGLFDVVAGGRRLSALQQLLAANELPEQLQAGATCSIVSIDVADEASLAENTIREAMHPADQVVAYKTLVDEGKSIADIAARFSVTELFVKQRLKLANVEPELFELFRTGGMSLNQLQALALTDNHALQKQAWFSAKHDYQRDAYQLRNRITQRAVADDMPIARFVGHVAYTEAGGALTQDLFNTRRWFADPALLDRLAVDKLEAKAEELRADGWSWVEVKLLMDHQAIAAFPRVPKPDNVSEEPLSKAVYLRINAINNRLDELDGIDHESFDDDQSQALNSEESALRDELITLKESAIQKWPTAVKETSGVLLGISDTGGVRYEYGRLLPGQKVATSGAIEGTPTRTADAPKPKRPEHSDAVLQNLSAHRTEVIRSKIMQDPHLAMALLVERLFSMHDSKLNDARVIGIQSDRVFAAGNVAKDLSPIASQAINQHLKQLEEIPSKGTLAWLRARSASELQTLLAILVGTRFDGVSTQASHIKRVDELHAATGVDMSDHWNPSCDSYLERLPRDAVVAAVAEAKGKDAAAKLTGLKKGDTVAEGAKLLAGTGWLPKPLRGPTYGKTSTKPAAAAGAAKPKTPAKKAAKKAAKKTAAKKKPAKAAKTAPVKKAAAKPAKAVSA